MIAASDRRAALVQKHEVEHDSGGSEERTKNDVAHPQTHMNAGKLGPDRRIASIRGDTIAPVFPQIRWRIAGRGVVGKFVGRNPNSRASR